MKKWSESPVTLYFAFGSNLSSRQWAERCPRSSYLCNGKLVGYKFAIVCEDDPESTASGFATVLPKAGSEVHGVLCALTPEDEKILDKREDVAKGDYIKMECDVVTERGHHVKALTYVNKLAKEGPPNKDYLEKIIAGALRHKLPVEAITQIASWAKK